MKLSLRADECAVFMLTPARREYILHLPNKYSYTLNIQYAYYHLIFYVKLNQRFLLQLLKILYLCVIVISDTGKLLMDIDLFLLSNYSQFHHLGIRK